MKKEVIIVDDHELFRDGLKFVLSQIPDINVVAEAANGKDFVDLLDIYSPDLVLIDIAMPIMDGIEATVKALEKKPGLKIIALSMYGDEDYYFKMIHAGAKGFVLKQAGKNELENAIKEVISGNNYFSQELLRKIIVNMGKNKTSGTEINDIALSKREYEVLQLICKGFSNQEIADQLHISPKTVDTHRTNLLSKTGSKNSVSLVMFAIRNKLVTV
jgi:DNA-binding NarL/FixJ family response regulator